MTKAIFLMAGLFAGVAQAATCTSKASGNWGTASTWTCTAGTVPAAGDTVILASPYTVTLDNNYTAALLTINSGATLSDTGGRTLTITGNIVNNGTFTSTSNGRIASTGAAAVISGGGTFSGGVRLYTSGTAVSIAAGSTLTFAGTATIRAGVNAGGTTVAASVLTINGTLSSTQTAGTNFLRLYASSTIIGSTGVIGAPNSTITYNTATAKLTNNGSVNIQTVTQNATGNSWTQGNNSNLTVSTVSTVGTLNASANGNTVTYNGTSTVINPGAAGYWNLAGTIFPAACPVAYTISGSSPCPAGGPVSVTANPGSCANTTGIGLYAWTPSPTTNVNSNDTLYATANLLLAGTSNYLKCTGYNFAIPATATILGVAVNVVRHSSGNRTTDAAMRLVKAGAIGTVDRSTTTVYPTTDATEAHGGSADLWGVAWTPADINLGTFGAAFASTSSRVRTISVNHMPITVTYQPAVAIDHIRIEHNGLACSGPGAPAQITIKACNDSACTSFYTTGDVTGINMSATGGGSTYTWSPANPQAITAAGGGINSGITLASSIATTAALSLSGTISPTVTNTYDCYNANTGVGGVAGSAACNLVFSTGSFTFDVPNHTSGTRQVVTLTSCKATFKNKTRDLKFWSTYTNPATGTLQGNVVTGTGNADCVTGYSALGTSSGSPTTLSLVFSNTTVPQATFSLCYADVGNVRVDTRYDGTSANGDLGTVILGNDSFIAKPAGFTLANIKRTSDNVANPGAADAGGTAFVKAGEAFKASVTAVNALGASAPNYGKESPPESVKLTPALVAGLGLTNNPAIRNIRKGSVTAGSTALTVGDLADFVVGDRILVAGAGVAGAVLVTTVAAVPNATTITLASAASTTVDGMPVHHGFSGGVLTESDFAWDEVGIITLTPSVADADYLGMGDITGTASGKVGRFRLGKFALESVTFDDRADLCQGGLLVSDGATPCASIFTYLGEEIDANFTLSPRSLNDAVVRNYVDSATAANDFAKLTPSTFADLNLAAIDTATAGGPYYLTARISNTLMPAASCATALCFESGSADVTVPFTLSRNAAADGVYGAVDIGIAPVDGDGARVEGADATAGLCNNPNVVDCYDLDTDAVAGNDRAQLGTSGFRYGRARVDNAFGSELLPMSVPIRLEFWNGANYATSVDDTFSVVALALGNYQGNLSLGATILTAPVFVNGVGTASLSAPGAGNNGSVDVTVSAPSYLSGDAGRATFGVYKGNNTFIYMREAY